jgi:hypothetical protein
MEWVDVVEVVAVAVEASGMVAGVMYAMIGNGVHALVAALVVFLIAMTVIEEEVVVIVAAIGIMIEEEEGIMMIVEEITEGIEVEEIDQGIDPEEGILVEIMTEEMVVS